MWKRPGPMSTSLKSDYNYNPGTPVETGIQQFVDWYREYYQGLDRACDFSGSQELFKGFCFFRLS